MSEISQSAYEQTDKLTDAAAPAGADFLLSNQNSNDRKMTITQLATFISTNPTTATLTFAATVTMDCDDAGHFDLTMTSNATLSAINMTAGAEYRISIAQNATASANTLAYASLFEFVGGVAPVLSLASAAKDTFTCYSPEGTTLRATLSKNFS